MDVKLLEEIGLTKGEIHVYLALLKLGTSKAGQLASKADVSSSKIYRILDRLIKKGLVGSVIKGKVKHFVALKPRRILDYLDEKEELLKQKKEAISIMLPELEKQFSVSEHPRATLFEGFKAVTNFFRNIIDDLEKGETYCVLGAGYGENVPKHKAFFLAHHRRRKNKGIRLKMLANYDERGNLVPTTRHLSEIRYLPQYLITNMSIVFYKNKAFIGVWTREPTGFLLENEEAVKAFRKYFNAFWKIAKSDVSKKGK